MSCDRALAIRELRRRARKDGISVSEMLPRLMLALYLRLQKVLDLTNADVRDAWGATLEELTSDHDYSLCQEIARIARRDGYEAIRFPACIDSAEANYAIFSDTLKPGSDLTVEGQDLIETEEN